MICSKLPNNPRVDKDRNKFKDSPVFASYIYLFNITTFWGNQECWFLDKLYILYRLLELADVFILGYFLLSNTELKIITIRFKVVFTFLDALYFQTIVS